MLGRRIGDERVEVSVWILGYLLLKANVSHRHLVYNDQAELLRGLIRNAPLVGASHRKAVMEAVMQDEYSGRRCPADGIDWTKECLCSDSSAYSPAYPHSFNDV